MCIQLISSGLANDGSKWLGVLILWREAVDVYRRLLSRLALGIAPGLVKRRRFRHLIDAAELSVSAREPEIQMVPWLIPEGTAFVDVGANRGEYLFVVEHQRPEVPSAAFEPIPGLGVALSRLFPRVDVRCAAVSDRVGSATLKIPSIHGRLYRSRATLNVTFCESAEDSSIALTVPLETIDHWIESSRVMPGFIKIDVEGHEWEVLRGAAATLRRFKPLLLVEIEQRHHPDVPILDSIRTFQRTFGYRAFYFDSAARSLVELKEPGQIRQSFADHKTRLYVNNFLFLSTDTADAVVAEVAGRIRQLSLAQGQSMERFGDVDAAVRA
jgi:FkbM family methyltransferase